MLHELMEDLGYEKDRLTLAWCSSAEPDKFVEAVTTMTARIKQLGPIAADAYARQSA